MFIEKGPNALHNVHCFGKKSAYKWEREDTHAPDIMIQNKKCHNR